MGLTVAFTGHRPQHLDGDFTLTSGLWYWIDSQITAILTDLGVSDAWCGGAIGVDTRAAITCLRMGIKLHLALPCRNQHLRWSTQNQLLYLKILSKAHETVYVSENYSSTCMQQRNVFMVNKVRDEMGKLISVHNGKPGGTNNCIEYARLVLKPQNIININPNDYEPSRTSLV